MPAHILLVEDNPGDARLIEIALAECKHDFQITHVACLKDALAALTGKTRLDGVLLDLSLPDAQGLETLTRVLAVADRRPTLVLTGLNDETLGERAVRAGAQDYLVKGEYGRWLPRAIVYAIERTRIEAELARHRDHLEELVTARTAELAESNRQLTREVRARRRTETALRQAKDAAERADETKSAFLANMSHELRTPLNAVLGFARVIAGERHGSLNEKQGGYFRRIVNAAEHMLALINDLLDWRRVEEGGKHFDPAAMPLRPAVAEAADMVAELIREHEIELTLDVPDVLPLVWADRRALVQIVMNLLSNAAKFTPAGGAVRVTAEPRGDGVALSVTDNGIGIARDEQTHLFTYWQQVGGKHTHRMHGSGVGLALTKAMVEKLGGRIELQSEPDRGSTFTVFLQDGDAAAAAARAATPAATPRRHGGSGRTTVAQTSPPVRKEPS